MNTKSNYIIPPEGGLKQADREKNLGQKAITLWFTGLSGSGKSTIALALEKKFLNEGVICYSLDGDNVRNGLCKDLGFSDEDRTENIRRISETAKLFNDAGIIVLSSFISPFSKDRENAKMIIGKNKFVEIFVNTPIEICEKRDPKGLYKKARAGEIAEFSGITSPYQAPESPALSILTTELSLEECVESLYEYWAKNLR